MFLSFITMTESHGIFHKTRNAQEKIIQHHQIPREEQNLEAIPPEEQKLGF